MKESQVEVDTDVVERLVDRCISSHGENLADGASELSRLGILDRGSIRTRGSLQAAAEDRLPRAQDAENLAARLLDELPAARAEMVLALGEWAGQSAVNAIIEAVRSDADKDVKLSAISGLGLIGGPNAATELVDISVSSHDEVLRDAALSALEELATGGGFSDMDPAPLPGFTPSPVTRTQPVRVRGASIEDYLVRSRDSYQWAEALSQLESAPDVSEYIRYKARQVLSSLA